MPLRQTQITRTISTLLIVLLVFGSLLFPNGAVLAEDTAPETPTEEGVETPTEESPADGGQATDGETGEGSEGVAAEDGASDGVDGTIGDDSPAADDGAGTESEDGSETPTDPDGGVGSGEEVPVDSASDGSDGESSDGSGTGSDGTAGTDDVPAEESADDDSGTEGVDGQAGAEPAPELVEENPGETNESPDDLENEPFNVMNEALIGDDDAPEGEDVTGGQRKSGTNTSIETGRATAQGDFFTQANSNNVRSTFVPGELGDLDIYNFQATGTNDALVTNDAISLAESGANVAYARDGGKSEIVTGDSIATFNVANVVNSNVINSDGHIMLANQILEPGTSLDLQDFFFPGGDTLLGSVSDCTLLSCAAEDVNYSFVQQNTATVTNDIIIEANSGANTARGDYATVRTGNAYGAANVINVVNANVVDSNYRLLTFNAIGDLDGDLILPTEDLFNAYFSQPNGMNQLEHPEDASLVSNNLNELDLNNNLDTYAESGLNTITSDREGDITTGDSEAESSVLNKVNENIFGGDSLYILLRVHGYWDGEIVGLPDGLTYEWTPFGVIIYNEDAEIAPSQMLGYDVDSFTAQFDNFNDVVINNNVSITANSGDNNLTGIVTKVTTGDAYASANVMNIANMNVVGANWSMAVITIHGDFDGNVSFTETDLELTGNYTAPQEPLAPGDSVQFTYSVTNAGSATAPDVTVRQTLQNALSTSGYATVTQALGDIDPGETVLAVFDVVVSDALPKGTSSVLAIALAESTVGEINDSNNAVIFDIPTFVADDVVDDGGGTGEDDGGSSEPDTTGGDTTPENETGATPATAGGGNGGGGGGSSGGGGGGGSSKTNSVERGQDVAIDPESAPMLVVTKEASSDANEDDTVFAGESVDYFLTITNYGGTAYDAMVYDTLRNPIDAIIYEESWELGTILPGEVIEIEYTTTFDADTPSGTYTNTASVEAYRHEDGLETGDAPLKLDTAVHTIEIEGVPLAVGNVQIIAYFPGLRGKTAALITWETSQPARSRVLYSPSYFASAYREWLPQYGFQQSSLEFEEYKTTHAMIIFDLENAFSYDYLIRAVDEEGNVATNDPRSFTVPSIVNRLTLAFQVPTVAGATTQTSSAPVPVSAPTPAPVTPATPAATAYVPPTPAPQPQPAPQPEPEPEPVPEPEPAPAPQPEPEPESPGFFGRLFSFW